MNDFARLIEEARLHDWGPDIDDYDLPHRLVKALEILTELDGEISGDNIAPKSEKVV